MKRVFCTLLALVMVLSMTACGGQPAETAQAETAGETIAETTVPETTEPDTLVTFAPVTVVDTDQCHLQITGMDPGEEEGYLYLYGTMTNKTEDTSFTLAMDLWVNGIYSRFYDRHDVMPGETREDVFRFYIHDIQQLDLVDYSELTLAPSQWEDCEYSNRQQLERVDVYPYGENAVTTCEWTPQEDDILIYDTEEGAAYITGYVPDANYDDVLAVNLMLINRTEDFVMYIFSELSLAGPNDNSSSTGAEGPSIMPMTLGWDREQLEAWGWSDVSQVEDLSFRVFSQKMRGSSGAIGNGSVKLMSSGEPGTFVAANCDAGHRIKDYTRQGEEMTGTCVVCSEEVRTPIDPSTYGLDILKGSWICTQELENTLESDVPCYTASRPDIVMPYLEVFETGNAMIALNEKEKIQGTLVLESYIYDGSPEILFRHVADGKTVGSICLTETGGVPQATIALADGDGYTEVFLLEQESIDSSNLREFLEGIWIYDPNQKNTNPPKGVEGYSMEFGKDGLVTMHLDTSTVAGYSLISYNLQYQGKFSEYLVNLRGEDRETIGTLTLRVHAEGTLELEYVSEEAPDTKLFFIPDWI